MWGTSQIRGKTDPGTEAGVTNAGMYVTGSFTLRVQDDEMLWILSAFGLQDDSPRHSVGLGTLVPFTVLL